MARYLVHVRTPLPAEAAFAYLADLTNFAAWDPGVVRAQQVHGDGPGPDAEFTVEVKAVRGTLTLRYCTSDYDEPHRFVARARARRFTSADTITVRPADSGSIVTYDARLDLNGPLGVLDPLVGLAFRRIGDRAAGGLLDALDGERVSDPRR